MSHAANLKEEPFVLVDRDARGVVRLELNRPQAFNALSSDMLSALQHELDLLAADESLRVLVISATGKAFCAGHDLREMRRNPSMDFYQTLFAQCSRMMMSLRSLPVPVIAAVDGVATAAGCQLVAMCDLAVASVNAKFAVSGVNLGLFCATPSVALSRNVSQKAAFEMLVTGDFISAELALQKGLINAVTPEDGLTAQVNFWIDRITAKPRLGIAMGKDLFYKQLEMPLAAAYQTAEHTMACNMMDDTALEGVQAFIDKRKPNW